jgi:hypothetical protein
MTLMSDGVSRRSQIDTETVRALLLINGGGAIALLTLLPPLLEKDELRPLASAILVGILVFMSGLICAVIHNRLRRKCSLIYDQHNFRPPAQRLFGFNLGKPRVCWFSEKIMALSMLCFFVAGSYVAIVGYITVKGLDRLQ